MFTHHLKAHFTDEAGLDVRLHKYIWHMPNDAITYKKFPALAAYIDRISAKQFNPRRFGVVEMMPNGYPRHLCSIKLTGDGEIKITGEKRKDYAPTKEERAAIEAERPGAALPKSINASRGVIEKLRKIVGRDALLFVCIDRAAKAAEGNVIMIEQRVAKEDGSKYFTPWTFWPDGKWYPREPDGGLPFWKPEKAHSDRIMIHEGPTKAAFVEALINDPARLATHPFGDVLAQYEHWGLLGGAYRADDMMWDELRAAKPSEVVYVCDNDPPGKSVLPKVSRRYRRALKGIMFDKDFTKGFDLADDMPKHLFAKTGKYVGPSWYDLLKFATWATKRVPNPEGKAGRPLTKICAEFAEEWVHCVTPEVYVHRDWPFDILTEREFNNKVRPYSDADDTARLLKADAASKTAILAYRPAKPPGIFAEDGKTYFNTHIAPLIALVEGDFSPFIEFMNHLIPDAGDRLETMRWCATLIVRGDIKMLYALLLISEAQGIGKGTLGEKILLPLVGKNNCSIPSESEIVDSNFNYWCAHKRLAVVHEIYAGHSAKAYNKLKSIVTDKYISVSKKFQANYEIENWIHLVACSNSKRALQLSMDDRRWLVPRLTEEKWPVAAQQKRFSKPEEYWAWFNSWLTEDEGLGKIKFWAREFLEKEAPVMAGAAAPPTEAKQEVVEASYSEGMLAVADWLDHLMAETRKEGAKPVVVTDHACRELIKARLYDGRQSDKLEKPATLCKLAKARGWFVSKTAKDRKFIAARGRAARYIASSPDLLARTPEELTAAGVRFIDDDPF